jgi:hypothetical protein
MKRKPKYPRLRAFCLSMFATFCVLFLCAGFLIADYNSRNTGFGDASMRIDAYAENGSLHVDFLGSKKAVEIPKEIRKWSGRVWNLLPPGLRAVFWILEGVQSAAQGAGSQGT